jgi:cysteine desulfurase
VHYLDHAATTDLRPEAADERLRVARQTGNASSTHGAGQRARRILEESRERLASALGCDPIEVVLTSGAPSR